MKATAPVVFDWKIDSSTDLVALVAIILFIGFMLIRILAMVSKGDLSVDLFKGIFKKQTKPKADRRKNPPVCAPYVEEHTCILKELQQGQIDVKNELRGIDETQKAFSEAFDVLLGLAKGEEANGQVDAARIRLAKAAGFREATQP